MTPAQDRCKHVWRTGLAPTGMVQRCLRCNLFDGRGNYDTEPGGGIIWVAGKSDPQQFREPDAERLLHRREALRKRRPTRAVAAVERVRALCDEYDDLAAGLSYIATDEIRAALDS